MILACKVKYHTYSSTTVLYKPLRNIVSSVSSLWSCYISVNERTKDEVINKITFFFLFVINLICSNVPCSRQLPTRLPACQSDIASCTHKSIKKKCLRAKRFHKNENTQRRFLKDKHVRSTMAGRGRKVLNGKQGRRPAST